MCSQGKHIGLLLLAGFLFPQAANALHYFLLPHTLETTNSKTFSFVNPGGYEYHYCDYHLTGTDFAVIKEEQSPDNYVAGYALKQKEEYTSVYISRIYYNYKLRGPPAHIFFSNIKSNPNR